MVSQEESRDFFFFYFTVGTICFFSNFIIIRMYMNTNFKSWEWKKAQVVLIFLWFLLFKPSLVLKATVSNKQHTYFPPYAWKTTDSFPVLMQPVMVSSIPALTILYRSKRVLGSTAFSYSQEMNTQFIKIIVCFTVSLEYLYTASVQLGGKNKVLRAFSQLIEKSQQTKQMKQSRTAPALSSLVLKI